jgi:hypothetical protein
VEQRENIERVRSMRRRERSWPDIEREITELLRTAGQ